jgi:hypothetical protein
MPKEAIDHELLIVRKPLYHHRTVHQIMRCRGRIADDRLDIRQPAMLYSLATIAPGGLTRLYVLAYSPYPEITTSDSTYRNPYGNMEL